MEAGPETTLSPWWKHTVILVMAVGFAVLLWLTLDSYKVAPPIPEQVLDAGGRTVFTGADIRAGQEVFLKYGLMENGTVWGHGAYLGPDFSAQYLHQLALNGRENAAVEWYQRRWENLLPAEQSTVDSAVPPLLKENRYDPATGTLHFTPVEVDTYQRQVMQWTQFFASPTTSIGLPAKYIHDPQELGQLTAFFAWTAWASVANRPGKTYSYTNNFPYDPLAGNILTSDSVLWSALSTLTLLIGSALVFLAFGKFAFLGWKGQPPTRPHLVPGVASPEQRATIKYFAAVTLLFLAQVLAGALTVHYRVEPGGFFGINLTGLLPSNIVRTWHLQLAVFWIATAYVGGGLFMASALAGREPRGQRFGIHTLFAALAVVVAGSLLGEILGINQLLGRLWFWFGHQGWEYLDLGRAWQYLLAIGLVFWIVLLARALAPVRRDPQRREMASLFLYAAMAIPIFYLPAMFFGSTTNFTVVDTWRFWIIHLWVEDFFEVFVTVMVALIFFELGLISTKTAARVVYLDALLFLGGGLVGTGHHWYWTGQSNISLALAASFSAMEVVPLLLLTRDAWDFINVTEGRCGECDTKVISPHRWTFYFLMAVGFWNFVGAGLFGFLINLPAVSYFEVGTMLTPNHGHAAMMGVFGMLAVALVVFALRQVLADEQWVRPEKFIKVSFWGLNVGLLLMVLLNLFPGGVWQLWDVLQNGYWHARGPEFAADKLMHTIEWLRLPADGIFIVFGVVPLVIAAVMTYLTVRRHNTTN